MSFWLAAGTVGGAIAVGAIMCFACDQLSKAERRRQDNLRREYNEYSRSRKREYSNTYNYYANKKRIACEDAERELEAYQKELIEKRKIENKEIYFR